MEQVPEGDFTIPLGQAKILQEGSDITVVGWGGHIRALQKACTIASQSNISCELIDLQTILPWDVETITKSVQKTGKLIVSHEAPITCGFGAEIVSTVVDRCFDYLQAPIQRVCGYDIPFPLVFEKYYLPSEYKNLEAMIRVMDYAI